MRKLIAAAVASVFVLFGLNALHASGPLGIYGIVDKVVFEPSEAAPQRLQVWGVFSVAPYSASGTPMIAAPKRGYLYYKLPAPGPLADIVKKEWNDLKAAAGTGQVVAFGGSFFPTTDERVRPATEAPSTPSDYQLNTGIVKLSNTGSNAAMVKQLKDAAARK
jgi:hypothetical protein